MPKGYALHIGLNSVDPDHYDGWSGPLSGCHNDAKAMHEITAPRYKKHELLLDGDATADNVKNWISAAAKALKRGDLFVLTYSGHGGQVPDTNGDEIENGPQDKKDETWCLWDRELVDDELAALWSEFAKGVRILVLSDSCHSGSVTRVTVARAPGADEDVVVRQGPPRGMPRFKADEVYEKNKEIYDEIQDAYPDGQRVKIDASILLISGCQDSQQSSDGDVNGLFTETLLRVWDNGTFTGGLKRFHREIAQQMPPWQAPNYYWVGSKDPAFERSRPFAV